ncbi:MAG: alpha/beta hydrolase [Gammaproteobacteria bacterium]|nr:alpha/beta hydrolase [Gammaproteobacteria bacterium]
MTKLQHHTANLGEVRLHYVVAGESDKTLVLLHGWPQTWHEWHRLIPELARNFRVIAPDLRGLGDSSRPTGGYDKKTVALDVIQLLEQLDCKRIQLVGHDWGGAVAYALAAQRPEWVERLAVLDIVLPGFGLEQAMAPTAERTLWHLTFHLARDVPEFLIGGRERAYISWFFKNVAYNPAAITEADIDEYVRCYAAPGALRAGLEYYRALFQDAEDNRNFARTRLQMPVLALGGDSSLGPYVQSCMEQLADHVKGAVIPECGHWIAEEQPKALLQHLDEFLT